MVCVLNLTPFLFVLSACPIHAASGLTYQRNDPFTRTQVSCDGCPPGEFLQAPCTATQKSVCAPCQGGTFTALWNYVNKCLRCSVCGHNQVAKRHCSATSDCQCECKAGYYLRHSMCVPHSECPSGHGVLTEGTPVKNTVCHMCPDGFFSNASSAQQSCMPHTNCSKAGLSTLLKGSPWHDSVCASRQESKDGAEYLKQVIPAFFLRYSPNIRAMRRIVSKLPSGKEDQISRMNFQELHRKLEEWVATATAAEIRQVDFLKNCLKGEFKRLQDKLDHIDTSLSRSGRASTNQPTSLIYVD